MEIIIIMSQQDVKSLPNNLHNCNKSFNLAEVF